MGSAVKLNRVAVIYHADRISRERLAPAVEAAINVVSKITNSNSDSSTSSNWDATLWMPTSANETGGPQAIRAISQGATHVLVAGGDGTIRSVAESLVATHATGFTLGIVPVGTGNVLARNLKIELNDLQRSVHRAINGREFTIDIGRAKLEFANGDRDERFFTAMAGVGLDAKIMMATDLELKRKIGWIAYIDGGLKTLPVRFERLQVSVDGREPRRLKLHSLIIGNAGWLPGNITLMPDARLDDGQLDVAAVGPRRFWNWIDFWSRVTWQNQVVRPLSFGRRWMDMTANLKTIENLNGADINVVSERPIDIQLDGDPLGKIIRVDFDVIDRAIVVRV